jgi:hypothetical protein
LLVVLVGKCGQAVRASEYLSVVKACLFQYKRIERRKELRCVIQ